MFKKIRIFSVQQREGKQQKDRWCECILAQISPGTWNRQKRLGKHHTDSEGRRSFPCGGLQAAQNCWFICKIMLLAPPAVQS